MAPVIPNPKKIKAFPTSAAFEAWLRANHDGETEIWLKIHKKDAGLPTVTHAQALDVALCWGWIDGIRKSFDERSFLQRFTPRTAKSIWSQVNRDHIARLAAAGRMTAARPASGRCGQSGRALGRRLRSDPQRDQSHRPRRPSRGHRRKPTRAQDIQHARSTKPLRAGVPNEQHEDTGRPREEDCRAGSDARARRDHRARKAALIELADEDSHKSSPRPYSRRVQRSPSHSHVSDKTPLGPRPP